MSYDFVTEKTPTARKPHKCFLCNEEITKGEKYVRLSGSYCGDFFDNCFHTDCNALISEYCWVYDDNEYIPEEIYDWIRDEVCEYCDNKNGCILNRVRCEKVLKIMEVKK